MLEVDHQYESMITLVFRGGKTPTTLLYSMQELFLE